MESELGSSLSQDVDKVLCSSDMADLEIFLPKTPVAQASLREHQVFLVEVPSVSVIQLDSLLGLPSLLYLCNLTFNYLLHVLYRGWQKEAYSCSSLYISFYYVILIFK